MQIEPIKLELENCTLLLKAMNSNEKLVVRYVFLSLVHSLLMYLFLSVCLFYCVVDVVIWLGIDLYLLLPYWNNFFLLLLKKQRKLTAKQAFQIPELNLRDNCMNPLQSNCPAKDSFCASPHFFVITDKDCESLQCLFRSFWARHQGVLLLFWRHRICWNAKVGLIAFIDVIVDVSECLGLLDHHVDFFTCLTCFSTNERSQIAYVTFKDSQGAETALLLSVQWYLKTISLNESTHIICSCLWPYFLAKYLSLCVCVRACAHHIPNNYVLVMN